MCLFWILICANRGLDEGQVGKLDLCGIKKARNNLLRFYHTTRQFNAVIQTYSNSDSNQPNVFVTLPHQHRLVSRPSQIIDNPFSTVLYMCVEITFSCYRLHIEHICCSPFEETIIIDGNHRYNGDHYANLVAAVYPVTKSLPLYWAAFGSPLYLMKSAKLTQYKYNFFSPLKIDTDKSYCFTMVRSFVECVEMLIVDVLMKSYAIFLDKSLVNYHKGAYK
ncbi:hypothetical protein BDF20DRAFT_839529 [Mycotypha africana]|uniref:uncharacterized protein n=1 Tax=Mycotypha africana TaxID=64632 RepID=UPI0023009DA1|nr:uncharacterized protein BDF20DRAFT_839529 [Mycotypha africana]KAI8968423.1 hypothetical protein BDF20DRAFT_839529 [Mycotypha africana]